MNLRNTILAWVVIAVLERLAAQPVNKESDQDSWIQLIDERLSKAVTSTNRAETHQILTSAMEGLPDRLAQEDFTKFSNRASHLVKSIETYQGTNCLLYLKALEREARYLVEYRDYWPATSVVNIAAGVESTLTEIPDVLSCQLYGLRAKLALFLGEPERALHMLGPYGNAKPIVNDSQWMVEWQGLLGQCYLELAEGDSKVLEVAGRRLRWCWKVVSEQSLTNTASAALVAYNLSEYYSNSDKPEESRHFAELALQIRSAILSPVHPDLALSRVRLAHAKTYNESFDEAEGLLESALPILVRRFGLQGLESVDCLEGLALTAYWNGETNKAEVILNNLLTAQRHLALQSCYFGDEPTRRFRFKRSMPLMVPGTIGSPTFPYVVAQFKGLISRSSCEQEQFERAARSPKAMKLAEEWRRKLEHYFEEFEAALENPNVSIHPDFEHDFIGLEEALATEGFRVGGVRRSLGSGIRSLGDLLARDTAVIDYFVHTELRSSRVAEPRLDAVVHLSGRPPVVVRIPAEVAPPEIVESYERAMKSQSTAEPEFMKAVEMVRRAVWDPVAEVLPASVTNIVICPEGPLWFVSFAGLVKDSELLGERYSFRYTSSVADLFGNPPGRSTPKVAALFADPDYNIKPSRGQTNVNVWAALPDTAKEASTVSEILTKSGWATTVSARAEFTKEKILKVKSPGILMLATHGFWNQRTSPYFSNSRDSGSVQFAMTGGGLVLSGCNWVAPRKVVDAPFLSGAYITAPLPSNALQPIDDSVLSATDLGGLDLRDTWLLILSACSTGLGEFGNSEGVFGLQRGALTAGARNILLSTGPVKGSLSAKFVPEVLAEALKTGDLGRAFGAVQSRTIRRLRLENRMPIVEVVRTAAPYVLLTREL